MNNRETLEQETEEKEVDSIGEIPAEEDRRRARRPAEGPVHNVQKRKTGKKENNDNAISGIAWRMGYYFESVTVYAVIDLIDLNEEWLTVNNICSRCGYRNYDQCDANFVNWREIGTDALTIVYFFDVDIDKITFKELAERFTNHFMPQKNITMERHKLFNRRQGCPISKQFGIQQTHLIQVVTDLAKQMVDLNRKVDLLLGKHAEENLAISELLASLPVKDDASFCHFNEQLEISRNKQAVMSFLAGIGGRNIRSLTTNILRRILQDEVAELYSLTGKQMKNSNKKHF
ncbi:hypothetical protein MSG28_013739 [Choristoneura fumiferana]|uniref:Uncharacterized protein n=1 Tax=Choristoneura fumiferana TaxID=7141 RepID=A0ACC0K8P8_CHOFU|nr:hypothetical protein MSG28_013739 [Choristoneura fumiferana]